MRRFLICVGAGLAAGAAVLLVAAAATFSDPVTYAVAGLTAGATTWTVDRLIPGRRLNWQPPATFGLKAVVFVATFGWWLLSDAVRVEVGPGWVGPAYLFAFIPWFLILLAAGRPWRISRPS